MNIRIMLLAAVVIVAGILIVSRVPTVKAPEQSPRPIVVKVQMQTSKVDSVAKTPRDVAVTSMIPVPGRINIKSANPSTMPTVEDLKAALDSMTPEQRREYEIYAADRVQSLLNLMTETDPQSVQQVVSEVLNPDIRIRDAALNSIKQIHTADSIPKIQEMIEKTDDPRMKVQLMDAIDYIKLPTMTEVREQRRLKALQQGVPVKPKKATPEPSLTAPVN